MRKLTSLLTILAVLVFVAVPVASVFAQTDAQKPDLSQIREQAKARMQQAKQDAMERKAEIQEQVKERRAQIKMDACERRQDRLNTVRPRLAQGATSVKKTIDKVYERVVGFYENGQLTVENYEELVADIETAKTAAEAAMETVASYTFEFDCENPNMGEQLDGYRTAVKDAKDALKDYRKALVALISSMKAAAAVENSGGEAEEETEQ